MVRVNERPRWKPILYFEFMAVEYRREIIVEGYQILLIALISPLWILPVGCYLLPSGCRFASEWMQNRLEMSRRAPYGGINVNESKTARPRWSSLKRRRSLSSSIYAKKIQARADVDESPLRRLPAKIRRQVFLYVDRPSPEVTLCALTKRARLMALPTSLWLPNASADGQQWRELLKCLNEDGPNSKPMSYPYVCNGMLLMAKTSRQMYREVIPLLYGENTFHFHPLSNSLFPGSMEHFLAFTHSIPPARLDSIRYLRLEIRLALCFNKRHGTYLLSRDGEYRWRRTCDTLKDMNNLLTLRININRIRYHTGSTQRGRRLPVDGPSPENRLLRRMVGVRARMECVVEVPWEKHVSGDLSGAEFHLREQDDIVDQSLGRWCAGAPDQ